MNEKEKSELDFLKGKRDVQRALNDTKRKKKGIRVVANSKDKLSLGTYVILLVCLAVLQYIVKIGAFLNLDFVNNFLPQQLHFSEKLIEGVMTVVLVLALTKFIKVLFINGVEDTATRFNLQRILNLLVGMILFFIVISILFANWYTAVVSLGLISLILGFALQLPITSFIAWIHIIITGPYKVGDRIKIAEATGDVIDIGYLETTLWETVGDSLSSDFPSGRVIKFPNSSILSTPVYNYSWPLFPYIWDEVKFYVSFDSDISFVSEIMSRITEQEMGQDLSEKIHLYHELLKETAVDEERIDEKPIVSLRIQENVWLEVSIRYLTDPHGAGALKSILLEKILREFLKHPEKVMLASGTGR